jgi:myo-inositol 2-dehydrogenase/D-chiro-inositol 1-dehydrogenase
MDVPARVGLIGSGFMGSVHRAAWRAVGRPVTDLLVRPGSHVTPEFAGVDVHTDLGAFLGAVDLVDICTPSDTHVELATAAAQAGRPTLCEKPLTLEVADALGVVAAFDRAGVPLQVAHVVRFFPEYVAARDAIVRGDIGDPAVLRLARLSFAPDRGADSWFADERRSGGLFFDLMIHDLDYARWIAGEVVRVHARATGGPRSYGIAVLTHASGAISHVEASWAEPAPVFRTRLEIAGSGGLLASDSADTAPFIARLHADVPAASTALADVAVTANPFEAEIRHFLDVVAGRRQPVPTAMDAVAAVRLAAAAARSAHTGVPVTLDELGAKAS